MKPEGRGECNHMDILAVNVTESGEVIYGGDKIGC